MNVLVVGQSGGPTAVMNTSLAGLLGAARFSKIYGLAHGLEGALHDQFLDLSHLTGETLDRLARTPGAALGSSRRRLDEGEFERVLDVFQKHSVDALAYIGGNGSMWVAHHLAERAAARKYALRVIGIPKTVDNDLAATDHSPGYGSAARFLALAARDTGLDLEAMTTFDDVVILETMGRDSGWLAAASALLKQQADDAPHLVYVPEIPFDDERFLNDVAAVHGWLKRAYIVVGEGIRYTGGAFVGAATNGVTDMLGRMVHGVNDGPGMVLARLVRERLGLQTRCFRPGNIGRSFSACVSEVDETEARRVGECAATALADGHNDVMVALGRVMDERYRGGSETRPYKADIHLVPLLHIINKHKYLPREYINAEGTMITPAFVEYALPLIGDVPPVVRFIL
ncbi:MAG: diphosphate--fructose-6-phosphate 1-phosphotransferase [Chloroflexi bacterium]|nr:diphosphate--fructose-6-phosphate 1-phosphotransferase [Chloroflexota bacterium]